MSSAKRRIHITLNHRIYNICIKTGFLRSRLSSLELGVYYLTLFRAFSEDSTICFKQTLFSSNLSNYYFIMLKTRETNNFRMYGKSIQHNIQDCLFVHYFHLLHMVKHLFSSVIMGIRIMMHALKYLRKLFSISHESRALQIQIFCIKYYSELTIFYAANCTRRMSIIIFEAK